MRLIVENLLVLRQAGDATSLHLREALTSAWVHHVTRKRCRTHLHANALARLEAEGSGPHVNSEAKCPVGLHVAGAWLHSHAAVTKVRGATGLAAHHAEPHHKVRVRCAGADIEHSAHGSNNLQVCAKTRRGERDDVAACFQPVLRHGTGVGGVKVTTANVGRWVSRVHRVSVWSAVAAGRCSRRKCPVGSKKEQLVLHRRRRVLVVAPPHVRTHHVQPNRRRGRAGSRCVLQH
mmetsp:Transcript_17431/g.41029  ORF Transcript_17431/g.41029 Transcript_17431/m.41029 type:complete len:234 (+) Transcript_17431:252-953(+)